MVASKRVYEAAKDNDGYRVLIDRLWPRGLSKQQAALDLWLKEVAPTAELRKWFNHKLEKFDEFSLRYQEELTNKAAIHELIAVIKSHENVTLLYAARDQDHNHAVVLLGYVNSSI